MFNRKKEERLPHPEDNKSNREANMYLALEEIQNQADQRYIQ